MAKTTAQSFVEKQEGRRLFQQEWSISAVTGLLCKRMHEQGVSRAELARRLEKTPGWVTQLLDGDRNKTVRTLSDAFCVLGLSLEFHDRPLSEVTDRGPVKTAHRWVSLDEKQFILGDEDYAALPTAIKGGKPLEYLIRSG